MLKAEMAEHLLFPEISKVTKSLNHSHSSILHFALPSYTRHVYLLPLLGLIRSPLACSYRSQGQVTTFAPH